MPEKMKDKDAHEAVYKAFDLARIGEEAGAEDAPEPIEFSSDGQSVLDGAFYPAELYRVAEAAREYMRLVGGLPDEPQGPPPRPLYTLNQLRLTLGIRPDSIGERLVLECENAYWWLYRQAEKLSIASNEWEKRALAAETKVGLLTETAGLALAAGEYLLNPEPEGPPIERSDAGRQAEKAAEAAREIEFVPDDPGEGTGLGPFAAPTPSPDPWEPGVPPEQMTPHGMPPVADADPGDENEAGTH